MKTVFTSLLAFSLLLLPQGIQEKEAANESISYQFPSASIYQRYQYNINTVLWVAPPFNYALDNQSYLAKWHLQASDEYEITTDAIRIDGSVIRSYEQIQNGEQLATRLAQAVLDDFYALYSDETLTSRERFEKQAMELRLERERSLLTKCLNGEIAYRKTSGTDIEEKEVMAMAMQAYAHLIGYYHDLFEIACNDPILDMQGYTVVAEETGQGVKLHIQEQALVPSENDIQTARVLPDTFDESETPISKTILMIVIGAALLIVVISMKQRIGHK